MRISFDFDGCLADNSFVQVIASLFQNAGHDIWIITSRDPQSENRDVWEFSKKFNIPKDRIVMTNGSLKVNKFLELKMDIHFDNSFDEVLAINNHFENSDPMKDCLSKPAIFVNFDSHELSLAINMVKNG